MLWRGSRARRRSRWRTPTSTREEQALPSLLGRVPMPPTARYKNSNLIFLTASSIHQTIGDEYKAPAGLPEWKQPSFDDDDRVDGAQQPFKPTARQYFKHKNSTPIHKTVVQTHCEDFTSKYIQPNGNTRVSGERSKWWRMRCTWPRRSTSSSLELSDPSSPCSPSTSRSSVVIQAIWQT